MHLASHSAVMHAAAPVTRLHSIAKTGGSKQSKNLSQYNSFRTMCEKKACDLPVSPPCLVIMGWHKAASRLGIWGAVHPHEDHM
eukprot:4575989-Amphidinium_carterae.1